MKHADNPNRPTNAWELVKAIDAEPDEGVIVCVFPERVDNMALTGEKYAYDPGVDAWGVLGDLGPWGTRLLDLTTHPGVPVKWWKVKEFAKKYGYDLVPERYNGAIGSIPDKYFDPTLITGIRFYNEGPWFWINEAPALVPDPDTERKEENLNVLESFTSGS